MYAAVGLRRSASASRESVVTASIPKLALRRRRRAAPFFFVFFFEAMFFLRSGGDIVLVPLLSPVGEMKPLFSSPSNSLSYSSSYSPSPSCKSPAFSPART
jgi:hypothetical protein